MPTPRKIRDNQTGEIISFLWHDDTTEPTETDLEEIISAHRAQQQPSGGASGSWDTPADRTASVASFVAGPGGIPSVANTRQVANDTGQWVKDNPGTTGSIVGSLAAAPFTGGMSVPMMMATEFGAAATGNALGHLTKRTATGEEINPQVLSDIAVDSVKEGGLAAATAGLGPAINTVGREMYHLALRPRLAMSHTPEEVAKLIDTGLSEGINVSRGGFQKAGGLIEQQANDVRKLIESLNAVGDHSRGLAQIDKLKARWAKEGALDEQLRALDDVAEQFSQRFGDNAGARRLEDLHERKQGIWRQTQNNWDADLGPAKKEAQKAYGSGLREEIETVAKARGVDDIATRNERMGNLMELQEVISGRAAYDTLPGLRQGVEVPLGMSSGAFTRAVATSSPVLSAAGRGIAAVGKFLDPRSLRPVPSHPPIGGKPKTTETSLDALGIPEVQGPAYTPDPLDMIGVPVERGARDIDQAWMQKFAPEPAISHRGPTITNPNRMLPEHRGIPLGPAPDPSFAQGVPAQPVRFNRRELPPSSTVHPLGSVPDTSGPIPVQLPENYGKTAGGLDIPETGTPYEPNSLDRFDIPVSREMYSPEELWIKKQLSEMDPRLKQLGFPEWKRLIKETIERQAEGSTGPVSLTKARVQSLYSRYLSQE